MAPSVRPDGRPSRGVCKTGSGTGRTAHFRAVSAQRGALTLDVRPVAPASVGCPILPAIDHARPGECHATATHIRPPRSRVPVGTIHDQNASGWHFSTSVVECVLRKLFIGICHRVGASWRSEPTWDAQYYHGTTKNRPRASWCVTNTDTQKKITPLRRFRLSLSLRLSARHTTRTRHDHTTHDEHHGPAIPTAHSPRRRANTHGRVRSGILFSGRRRRVVVGGAFG